MYFSLLYKKRLLKKKPGLLLLLIFFFINLAVKAQEIDLSVKNASIQSVFSAIKKQTGYNFIFTTEDMLDAKPITLSIHHRSLPDALALIFKNQPLTYTLKENYVLIKPRRTGESGRVFEIKGMVTDEKGEPVISASVKVKNSNEGTLTDEEGKFDLKTTVRNSVLIISSIGFETMEIAVAGKRYLVIAMKTSVSKLDETVVIAYGSTTRRLNTGSVSTVTSDEISRQPVSNPIAALEGRVPGLFITQNNGLPGANFSVNIGGRNSIQNGTDPLYIIDGVPFISDKVSQRGAYYNANNPFNTINPLDIASIEVLKDADATAIYGSRGANGVILITTKKAKSGKTQVEINFYTGFGNITKSLDYLNTHQYLQMRREAFSNDSIIPTINNAPDLVAWDTSRYTNLKSLILGGTSRSYNSQIRLSGGGLSTQFSFGANYYKESTVFPGTFGNQRASIDLSIAHSSSKNRFHISITTSYGNDQSTLPSAGLITAITLPPDIPSLYDSLGKLNWKENGTFFTNPLSNLLQTYKGINERLTSNSVLTYRIRKNLFIKTNLGFNNLEFNETSLTPISSQNPVFNPKGSASFGTNKFQTWIIEPQVEYSSEWRKKGVLTILAGTTWQRNVHHSTIITGTGYLNDALLETIGGASFISAANGYSQYKYQAIFSRINFDWDKKYILNLTGRRDGSSRFGPGRQFANFGALGAAWIFTEESAIKKALPFLNFGKIRGSYGVTGNDQIGDYQYLDTWSNTQYPYQGTPGLRPTRIFNATYNWERNKKISTSVDLGFLHERIWLSMSWYRSISDNQLISYTLPTQTGFPSIIKNFPGVIRNNNWEFEINVVSIKRKKFNWKSSFNLTLPKNRLLSFPGLASSSYATTFYLGKPLNSNIGFHYLGIDPQTGVYSYEDVDKNGFFDKRDYVYNGSTDPVFYGGFENDIQYKNWRLNFFFSFTDQSGADPLFSGFNLIGSQKNMPVSVLNHWQKQGDRVLYEKFSQNFGTPATKAGFLIYQSGAALTDASYIRLKNLSLSYSLPQLWLNKIKIKNCRFYFEAQNLVTLTRYRGADPESQNGIIPPLKMLVTGIQINF